MEEWTNSLPCHGKDCGFESRYARQRKKRKEKRREEREKRKKGKNMNEEDTTLEELMDRVTELYETREASGMNDQEFRTMSHLTGAWDHFLKIPNMREDDKAEFLGAIHTAQQIIGMSILRRDRPELWV